MRLWACRIVPRAARRLWWGLKPILKPTGRETMRPQANEGAETDLKYKGKRRHATPKFESPLPHYFRTPPSLTEL
jgi:hypothetical protein